MGRSDPAPGAPKGATLGLEALVRWEGFYGGGGGRILADLPPLCNPTQTFIAAGGYTGRWGGGMRQINYRGGGSWAGAQLGVGGELRNSGNP